MIFETNFHRSASFLRFKKDIDAPQALEYIFSLFSLCRTTKSCQVTLKDAFDFECALGLPAHIDGDACKEALLRSEIIKPVLDAPNVYNVVPFEKENGKLLASWKNGKAGGAPKHDAIKNATKVTQVEEDPF